MSPTPDTLGESIPANTPHAVSVSLPTWNANVGYEEAQDWVVSKMTTGYPRFYINKLIIAFANDILGKYGQDGEQAMLFPSQSAARRCVDFVQAKELSTKPTSIRVLQLILVLNKLTSPALRKICPSVSAVLLPEPNFVVAKQYWQHSGDGISSRHAEFCHGLFQKGLLVEEGMPSIAKSCEQRVCKGPRRYQRELSTGKIPTTLLSCDADLLASSERNLESGNFETGESSQFIEERFGRNLDVLFMENAKSAIRRRIAGSLTGEVDLTKALPAEKVENSARGVKSLSETDVYLYPCGMNSIFHTHQTMLEARGQFKSIMFGFPYVDTLKILEKFGPGCLFYGHGSSEELDDLEIRLKGGERYLALFCEFPGNPLLSSPDLKRIKLLGEKYDFAVIVDETIGNFINIHVLPYADIVVSSLTKVFTGECNVMGGSAVLNPNGQYYQKLKDIMAVQYEDTYWAEDVIFMERNSRDFLSRITRINRNAELICDILKAHPVIREVYYPKLVSSRPHYDACRTPNGGYGGLLSVTFHTKDQAVAFFDHIETAKGPSLGTNFTLTSPYVVLAHYWELEWAAKYGVDPNLIRISVGLENKENLEAIFHKALDVAERSKPAL